MCKIYQLAPWSSASLRRRLTDLIFTISSRRKVGIWKLIVFGLMGLRIGNQTALSNLQPVMVASFAINKWNYSVKCYDSPPIGPVAQG